MTHTVPFSTILRTHSSQRSSQEPAFRQTQLSVRPQEQSSPLKRPPTKHTGPPRATSGTFRPTGSLEPPQTLPVRRARLASRHATARRNPVHHFGPGNTKPQLPWKPRSPAPSQRTPSERRGRLPHPTGSPGQPRSPPRPGSPHAGQGHPLGVREPLAPHTARPGPRSEASASTPARGLRPEEAGLSPRGALPWVGLGAGRRAGVGEASERRQGQLQQGDSPLGRGSVGKGKTPPARGGGEKSRARAGGKDKASEISRDEQTLAKWRLGHVIPAVL